jgi:hypothetical protein
MKVSALFYSPSVLFSLVLLGVPIRSQALVSGTVTGNPDGTFTYAYTVNNSSGPFDIGAWSLDFGITLPDWDQTDTLSGGSVSIPNADWFATAGTPISGQSAQDFISLNPAADVAVGSVLSGFSFTSHHPPGPATYHEFSGSGDSATGQTVGPANVTVPDDGVGSATLFLLVVLSFFGSRNGRLRASVVSLEQQSSSRQRI